jgi:PKD repeat protein
MQATGTVAPNSYGSYYNWGGRPAPSLLSWFPDLAAGTVTGQDQAAWSIATSADGYVLFGGEFPTVDGATQAGLVRFAVPSIAPNHDGPRLGGTKWVPTAVSTTAGTVRVSWLTNWDRDNERLTYSLYRNGNATPIFTTTADSDGFWNRPYLTFVDGGLTPGSTPTYQVKATDPFGNSTYSSTVGATVGATNPGSYANTVLADGASDYWRFDEGAGATSYDWAGGAPLALGTGAALGQAGALVGDGDTAVAFNGTTTGTAATQQMVPGPNTFSVEAWFSTTTTLGGKIVGFGNLATGASQSYDRHIYMDTNGTLHFGVSSGGNRILTSGRGFNDGRWHQVVGTLSAAGMTFFVDGRLIGTNAGVTTGGAYSGYWRIGGDKGWTSQTWFNGTIDDVAVYPTALSAQQIAGHYQAGTVTAASTATASMTASTSDLAVHVDGSASSDTGSTITGYAWDFGDGSSASGATADHTYATAGTYTVKLTVTDALGATATTSRSVAVNAPVLGVTDSFSRTVGAGLGSADTGGAWTTSGGSSNISVGSGVARFSTPAGITLNGWLGGVSLASSDVQATVTESALPVGGSAYAYLVGRRVVSGTTADDYNARLTVSATGAVTISVLHGTGTVVKTATVSGLTVAPGTQLRLRVQVIGSNPTTIQARVWAVGTTEPSTWQVSATDSTAALQASGAVGIRTYSGGGVTNGPLVTSFDDFAATTAQ